MKARLLFSFTLILFVYTPCDVLGSDCINRFQTLVPGYARTPHYKYPTPPQSYHSALTWVNALLGNNSLGVNGSVIVRKLELWEVSGRFRKIIAKKLLCETCTSKDRPFGYLWPIAQWTHSSSWSKPENEGYLYNITPQNYVEAPVSQRPDMVYHFWQADWPRPLTKVNSSYVARAEVFVTGNAMVNIGFDHYEQPSTGDNIEGASSKWVCAKAVWQEVVAGDFGNSIPLGQNIAPTLSILLNDN